MTYKKINSVATHLGELNVGDKVRLSWTPGDVTSLKDDYYKIYAIWENNRRKSIGLGLTKKSINNPDEKHSWWGGTSILEYESLIEIRKTTITNWKKEINK